MNNKENVEKVLAQYLVLSDRFDKAYEKYHKASELLQKKKEQLTSSIEKEFPDLEGGVLIVGGKALSLKRSWGCGSEVIVNDLI